MLLSFGADVNIRGKNGLPMDVAASIPQLKEILQPKPSPIVLINEVVKVEQSEEKIQNKFQTEEPNIVQNDSQSKKVGTITPNFILGESVDSIPNLSAMTPIIFGICTTY